MPTTILFIDGPDCERTVEMMLAAVKYGSLDVRITRIPQTSLSDEEVRKIDAKLMQLAKEL